MPDNFANRDLNTASRARKDEFYTQLTDIEKEMKHYRDKFEGKTVLCNCDDPYESNFFKYFAMNFNSLKLKKLIATSFASSEVSYTQLSFFDDEPVEKKPAYFAVLTEIKDENNDGAIDLKDVEITLKKKGVVKKLKGDGDFRSEECLKLLEESDIVCTNPPFSLFREFVSVLTKYNKKFIIIGNVNAISYKEIFSLIKKNELWLGASIHSGDREFRVPDDYPLNAAGSRIDENGTKFIRVKGVRWFTNLDYEQRHEELIIFKKYNDEDYPHYDNYDAIEVSKTADIPCDFSGVMGVPITFLDKYNPDQFEILGMESSAGYNKDIVGIPLLVPGDARPSIDGKTTYARIFITNKELNNNENQT